MDWQAVSDAIGAAIGERLPAGRGWPIGGGSINSAFRYEVGQRAWFLKLNRVEQLPMFEAEAAGLRLIAQPGGPRVPAVVALGETGGYAFLVLEYIPLKAAVAPDLARLGERLAVLHRVSGERFGWKRDNTIGTTPQINTPDSDWVSFYRERRLRYQLELATTRGNAQLAETAAPLLEGMGRLFAGYRPEAALLHGDLWSGNAAATYQGDPVIFDPAPYFGDRESDIAMTELFGGFTPSFYQAYRAAWPLDAGYETRRDLYQLYHVLNHLNLFGGGYRAQAERLIERLKAAIF